MRDKGITYEPSAPYSQEENGVAESGGKTITIMTRATILEGNILDILWPEIVLAMAHTKNVRPTTALGGISPEEARAEAVVKLRKLDSNQAEATMPKDYRPRVDHLRVPGSTVYVFIHEEERMAKSAKFDARATKGRLVGYDGHTIYRVYLERPERVVHVKDLRIIEDTTAKCSTEIPTWDSVQVHRR